jgi:phosphate transport system substrate-binding protein
VQGQPLNQASVPLDGIRLQAFNSSGVELDAGRSKNGGGFLLKLPVQDRLYRITLWDEFNRWWGRNIADLHNDRKHVDLGPIGLRPQSAALSGNEKSEQNAIIAWLWRHNPLSAAMMELHIAALDRAGALAHIQLAGAGATNAYPLQAAWSADYTNQHPEVSVNYQATGSGSGVRAITSGTIDFGVTDLSLTEKQLSAFRVPLQQLPIALSGTVLVYSEKLPVGLRFSGPVLAKIYLGEIKTWSDPELVALNPGMYLPSLPITPIHRSDASATTATLSQYLSGVSPFWRQLVGSGPAVQWKVGIAAKADEGVSGTVRSTEGGIGYVDFAFAQHNHLRMAAIENVAERFVSASPDSISNAASGVGTKLDLRQALTRPISPGAYPMASAVWALIPVESQDRGKILVLLDYINFSLGQAQSREQELGYVPLPPALEATTRRELNNVAAKLMERPVALPDFRPDVQ